MAQYNYSYNPYNIEQFEPRAVPFGSAAPKVKPNPQKRPELELVKKVKKSAAQAHRESMASAKQARKIFLIAVTVLMFMAMVIYSRLQLDEVNRDINAVEKSIELAQSDTVKLNNSLSSMVSMNNVESYAANELGMVKVQDYQVVYVDLSSSDRVVTANGKSADSSPVINNSGE